MMAVALNLLIQLLLSLLVSSIFAMIVYNTSHLLCTSINIIIVLHINTRSKHVIKFPLCLSMRNISEELSFVITVSGGIGCMRNEGDDTVW